MRRISLSFVINHRKCTNVQNYLKLIIWHWIIFTCHDLGSCSLIIDRCTNDNWSKILIRLTKDRGTPRLMPRNGHVGIRYWCLLMPSGCRWSSWNWSPNIPRAINRCQQWLPQHQLLPSYHQLKLDNHRHKPSQTLVTIGLLSWHWFHRLILCYH